MSKTIAEHAVKYAEISGKTLGAAVKIAEHYEADLKAAESNIPAVLERLKKAGFIDDHDVRQATTELGRHGDTLAILSNVIDEYEKKAGESRAKEASADLGSAAGSDGSIAAGTNKYANWTGRRRGDDDAPADSVRALFAGLGLAAPGTS